jgi:hypothetical protein
MRIVRDCKSAKGTKFAKTAWMAAACVLVAAPGLAQNERSGSSKPVPVTMASPDEVDAVAAPAAVAKPSAAVPAAAIPAAATETFAPYNPATDVRRPLVSAASVEKNAANDPDAGIVTYVRSLPGEIPDGTLMRVKLRETLSTLTTKPGSRFSAEVTEPVMRDGQVVVPVGSVLDGRVTWMRAGKRISGGAAIHLEPRTVTMPDGTHYELHARVIDTNSWDNTKVDSEGTIRRRSDGKKMAAVMGLTTGGGAAAGAMIGGVPGALIGAGVGAGVSTIVWFKQDQQAELPKDLGLVFSLTVPMQVTPTSAAVAARVAGAPGGE